MFGVLKINGDTLAYDVYTVATDGNSAPVLYDTLRVKKTLKKAKTFSVTPYVQHPATNAMSLIWFTKEPGAAKVTWWKASGDGALAVAPQRGMVGHDGGGAVATCEAMTSGVWAEALTNNLYKSSDTMVHGRQYRHRIRLTGLETGTRYGYMVELDGTTYSNTFRTAPGKDSSVRFIYYNDSETEPGNKCTTDWTDPATGNNRTYYITKNTGYASNIVHMVKREPDLFVIAGDLAAQGGLQQNWDEFWKHNAGGNGLGYNDPAGSIPILAAIGNHDLQDQERMPTPKTPLPTNCENPGGGESALERYLSYFEYEPNGVKYEIGDGETFEGNNKDRSQMFHRLDYGPVTLIFLDTNNGDDSDYERDTNTGLFRDPNNRYGMPAGRSPDFNPGSKQYTWLTNNLADAQAKSKFTFVVNHHCPYSVGYHNRKNVVEGKEWLSARAVRVLGEAMIKYGVDGWLCGHDEMVEHSQISGLEVLPNGTTREKTVDIFDMGTAGDGLRGEKQTAEDNPKEVWRAHKDAPEVWENGVLVDGGKHYGHMEINVEKDANGKWKCTLTPVYIFVNSATGPFERRVYDDMVTLYADGETPPEPPEPPQPSESFAQWWRKPQVMATVTRTSGSNDGMNTHYMNKDVGDALLCVNHGASTPRTLPLDLFSIPQLLELEGDVPAESVLLASTTPATLWGSTVTTDQWKGCAISPDVPLVLPGLGAGTERYTWLAGPGGDSSGGDGEEGRDGGGAVATWAVGTTAGVVTRDTALTTDGLDFSSDGARLYSNDYNGKKFVCSWLFDKSAKSMSLEKTFESTITRIRNIAAYQVNGRELVYYGEGTRGDTAAKVCVLDVTGATWSEVTLTNAPALFTSDIMNVKLSGAKTAAPTMYVATDKGQLVVFRLSADGKSIMRQLKAFEPSEVGALCGLAGAPSKFRNFEVTEDGTCAFFAHDNGTRCDLRVVRTPSADGFTVIVR